MPTTAQDNRLDLRSTSFIEGGRPKADGELISELLISEIH